MKKVLCLVAICLLTCGIASAQIGPGSGGSIIGGDSNRYYTSKIFMDNICAYFGSDSDFCLVYDETTDDALEFNYGTMTTQNWAVTTRTVETGATTCANDGGDLQVTTVVVNNLTVNDAVQFAAGTGTLCTGITASTTYYVTQIDSSKTFNIAATRGGTNITYTNTGTAFNSYELVSTSSFYGQLLLEYGRVAAPAWAFAADPDTGCYLSGIGQISCGTSSTRRFYFESTGFYFSVPIFRTTGTVTCASDVCTDDATKAKMYVTTENAGGADVLTVADGSASGLTRTFCLAVDGTDDLEVTPTHFINGSKVTLGTAGECITLGFDGTNWYLEANPGGGGVVS